MIALDTSEVKVRGEDLGEIWWRGKQWAVTSDGIETLDGTYAIEKHRLLESIEEYPWPVHIGKKSWCDSNEFATAFMVGLVLHGFSQIDSQNLRDHIGRIHRKSNENI